MVTDMLPSRIASRPLFNRGVIAETGCIPAGLKLIRDTFEWNVIDIKHTMTEGKNGKEQPVMKVTGLFQYGDKENANGR